MFLWPVFHKYFHFSTSNFIGTLLVITCRALDKTRVRQPLATINIACLCILASIKPSIYFYPCNLTPDWSSILHCGVYYIFLDISPSTARTFNIWHNTRQNSHRITCLFSDTYSVGTRKEMRSYCHSQIS